MITEIKMEVTPDLSTRIQEIVFANGGSWGFKGTEIKYLSSKYLYIEKKGNLAYGEDKNNFKKDGYKEISPYDFITSQGQQEWLPKYGEEAMFSDNEKDWHKRKFKSYLPDYSYPFIIEGNIEWKYCKPIPKEMSFIQFLKDNSVYDRYIHNIKIENQRWAEIDNYIETDKLKKENPSNWLFSSFNWLLQKEDIKFWNILNKKWLKIIEQNSDTNIVWGE